MVEAVGAQVASDALEGLGQRANLLWVEAARARLERLSFGVDEAGDLAHFLDRSARNAREIGLEEDAQVGGLGGFGETVELAQFDAVRVRLDGADLARQPFGDARPVRRLPVRVDEGDAGVRVDDARHAQVLPDALLAALELGLHAAAHVEAGHLLRAVLKDPRNALFLALDGLVRLGVKAQFHFHGRGFAGDFGAHVRGFAGGELAVHHHTRDADALLTAGLADGVEARTEEQLSEHLGDAVAGDAGAVVLDLQFDDVALRIGLADADFDVRQNARFLARVEGVVHGLLDGRDEGAVEAVKAEEVLVLLKELRDGGLLLIAGHSCGDVPLFTHASTVLRSSSVLMTSGLERCTGLTDGS